MARNNLIIRLGAQVSGAVAGLKKVTGGLADLGKKAAKVALKGVAAAVAGIVAAGAGRAALGTKVLKLGANAETTRLAFQTMLGSVAAGERCSFSSSVSSSIETILLTNILQKMMVINVRDCESISFQIRCRTGTGESL